MLTKLNTDLRKVLAPYTKGRLWVALTEDNRKVVGSGKSAAVALQRAQEAGATNPVLMKALPDYSGFISAHR